MNRKANKLRADAARLIREWPDLASRWYGHVARADWSQAEHDVLRFGRRFHSLQSRAARMSELRT